MSAATILPSRLLFGPNEQNRRDDFPGIDLWPRESLYCRFSWSSRREAARTGTEKVPRSFSVRSLAAWLCQADHK
jgi:hypothetical protein